MTKTINIDGEEWREITYHEYRVAEDNYCVIQSEGRLGYYKKKPKLELPKVFEDETRRIKIYEGQIEIHSINSETNIGFGFKGSYPLLKEAIKFIDDNGLDKQ